MKFIYKEKQSNYFPGNNLDSKNKDINEKKVMFHVEHIEKRSLCIKKSRVIISREIIQIVEIKI